MRNAFALVLLTLSVISCTRSANSEAPVTKQSGAEEERATLWADLREGMSVEETAMSLHAGLAVDDSLSIADTQMVKSDKMVDLFGHPFHVELSFNKGTAGLQTVSLDSESIEHNIDEEIRVYQGLRSTLSSKYGAPVDTAEKKIPELGSVFESTTWLNGPLLIKLSLVHNLAADRGTVLVEYSHRGADAEHL